MKRRRTRFLTLLLLVMLIGLEAMLSGCAARAPSVIRGSSEVIKLKTGDVATVPVGWEPPAMYCMSPQAVDELLQACQDKVKP